jgi:hypothetical protein
MTIEPGDRVLFMKVGTHAKETLGDIIARKRAEIEAEGFALWGYGGNTCHPRTMVQPFARASTGPIILAMHPMTSNHFAEPLRAEEYSADGVTWTEVPPGINCVGSRYALCVDSLEEVDLELDLSQTRVAVGPNKGRLGTQYVQGRVDKACLDVTGAPEGDPRLIKVGLTAVLMKPYAVFLRS